MCQGITDNRSLRTSGTLYVAGERTRVLHQLSLAPDRSATLLRISALYGKKFKVRYRGLKFLFIGTDSSSLNYASESYLSQLL